jgi:hypothetical protein
MNCVEHSGCIARIGTLEKTEREQWAAIDKQGDKVESIVARLNVVLGGVAVSCILLVVDIVVK